MHVRAALDAPPESRLTPDDIKEVIMMAAIYCGVPVANHAFGIATAILREKGLLPSKSSSPAASAATRRARRSPPARAGSTSLHLAAAAAAGGTAGGHRQLPARAPGNRAANLARPAPA
jgi:hypothetical protein